jgi:hypothetical protein
VSQPAKVSLHLVGRLVELPPGDADHMPARGLEPAVAGAVGLEGVRRVMDGATVELDDEPRLRPDTVDLEALDSDVGLRERKTGSDEEGLEALLELASDDPKPLPQLLQHPTGARDPASTGMARDQVGKRERIGQPQLLGLPQCAS